VNTTILGWKGLRFVWACALLLALSLAAGEFATARAQEDYAVNLAQQAVRDRIIREQGGTQASVNFGGRRRVETYSAGSNRTGVRGEGTFRRDTDGRRQRFTYEAVVNTRNGRVQSATYNFSGDVFDDDNDDNMNVPRWLVGTFRGINPAGARRGIEVRVTVDRSGYVTVEHPNGSRETGRYENGQFLFTSRPTWDVTRAGRDGFRASTRRRTEEFVRISGPDYDAGRPGSGRVPNWAVGTFRGMTDSGESELTINSDGSATARSLRTGESFYGTYDGRTLRFDWGEYDVRRENDGIRTINVNNRNDQTIYRRY
jgi:hypothetical protein